MNGNIITYVSGNIVNSGLNPSMAGMPITVYVSRTDPNKYYVDVSQFE